MMEDKHRSHRRRKRSRTLAPEQVEWAYEKWCSGYPLQEIADKLYVSLSVVYKAFDGRKRKRPPLESFEKQ